jgi:hypothetical protein
MLDTIKNKETEIIKMRQTIESQVENIRVMEGEIKDLTVKYKAVEQGMIEECSSGTQQPTEPDAHPKEVEVEGKAQEKSHEPEIAKQKSTVKESRKKPRDT